MIKVNCNCGESYNFKDEMEGSKVSCTKCNSAIEVKSDDRFFSIFNRDKFFLNQKHLSLSEEYYVYDENANQLLFVERSRKWFKLFLGVFLAIIAMSVYGVITEPVLISLFGKGTSAYEVFSLFNTLLVVGLFMVIVTYINGKRNIYFYESLKNGQNVIKVEQTNLFQFPHASFEVKDQNDNVIAKLRKNHMFDIFRKRWYWSDADDKTVAVIKEESIILAILRKFLGSLFGLLRMNFIFKTNDNITFGEFNRKLSLTDKYVLDLSIDKEKIYDRKVCLAIGVLLDTGEKR